jgi:hypothetical protein
MHMMMPSARRAQGIQACLVVPQFARIAGKHNDRHRLYGRLTVQCFQERPTRIDAIVPQIENDEIRVFSFDRGDSRCLSTGKRCPPTRCKRLAHLDDE